MPADATLALRAAETAKAPPASRGAPPEPAERPADEPVTKREVPREPPERPAAEPATKREAPWQPPERPADQPSAAQKERSPRRPWIRWALFAMLPLILTAGSAWYLTGGQVMSTDDAYVEANTVGISTDVPGIVNEIDVTNNQHVDPGQVLYRTRSATVPDRPRQRQSQPCPDGADHRRDEAGLPTHVERCRRPTGPGRARSGNL